jgi:hypothetical protein
VDQWAVRYALKSSVGVITTHRRGPPANPNPLLVAIDRLLSYTVVRHARDSEEDWLRLVFNLEVRSDPGLRARYRALSSAA